MQCLSMYLKRRLSLWQMRTTGMEAPEIKSITVKNIGSDTKVDAMLSGDIDLAQGPDATALNRVENNDDINIVKVTGTRENDFELNCREGNPLSDKNLVLHCPMQ